MRRLDGILLLPDGFVRGAVEFDDVITRVETAEPVEVDVVGGEVQGSAAASLPLIVPGFIDTHVHGGAGGDTMDGPDGVVRLATFHRSHGTTTILPTTMTNPFDRVLAALRGVATVLDEVARDRDLLERLPAVHGAHLEGPFISPDRLGAQPPNAVHPSPELVAEALATGVVRVVTLAPEVEGAVEAAGAFAAAGTRVSIGHTVAGHADVAAVAAAVRSHGGTLGFTHLYNAMPGLGSREPGVVGAAFADASAFAEVILDLHHVHAVSFMAAVTAKPGRLHLITDAIRAAGSGDGASELGGQPVVVAGGAARLHDGTLAGSVLTLDRALRNAVSAGMRLRDALALTTAVPADYLGLADRGRIAVGTRADLVVLDSSLAVTDVWVGGRPGE